MNRAALCSENYETHRFEMQSEGAREGALLFFFL
jgi:hypothetical protein